MKPKILIIHPYDRSSLFLHKTVKFLLSSFREEIFYFPVSPNSISHEACLEIINDHPKGGLILFLGHGRSDKLYGAKSDDYDMLDANEAFDEIENSRYYNCDFINENNVFVFKEKGVICFSCNSRESIGKRAIDYGAKCFVGFGDIPSSEGEFLEKNTLVGDKTIAVMKGELNLILRSSLLLSIKQRYSFIDFKNIFSFYTNKSIFSLLLKRKGLKTRKLLADHLYYIKNEITVYGNGQCELFV